MFKKDNSQKVWRLFSWMIIAAILLSGCAETPAPKVYRVGILTDNENFSTIGDGFKSKMTELGYIEGQNVTYEMRKAAVTADATEEVRLAKELVDAKVDLIFAYPSPPTIAAYDATQDESAYSTFA